MGVRDGPPPLHFLDAFTSLHSFRYCGEYVQGRHFEKLGPDEVEIHVKDKTLQHWARRITTRGWGIRILIKYGGARDKSHAKTFTVGQVKRLFNKVCSHLTSGNVINRLTNRALYSLMMHRELS